MEQIELEAVAFLILLEDVAAQAPGMSNDRTRTDVEGEAQEIAPDQRDSLPLHPNGEISALGRMRELLEATRPTNESADQREHRQPSAMASHLEAAGSRNQAAQDPVDKSLLLLAGDVSPLDESRALTTDGYRSRSRLETDDYSESPTVQRRKTTSETIHENAETNSQGTDGRTPYAIASAELYVPSGDLASLPPMPSADDGRAPLAIGDGLTCVPPTDRVWPTHHATRKARETGSDDALQHSNPDLSRRPSVAALIHSEESTYAGSRTTQRRAARQQNQNRELARRIALLEDQLGLTPDNGRFQNSELHPRLCYPV